jgi:hypothetical protein
MEARALFAAGVLMTAGALVWLFGPWGLLGSGLALTTTALFLIDVKERARAEAVEDPAWSQRGGPVRR